MPYDVTRDEITGGYRSDGSRVNAEEYPEWRCNICGATFDGPPVCPECPGCEAGDNVEKNPPPRREARDPGDEVDEKYQQWKDGD